MPPSPETAAAIRHAINLLERGEAVGTDVLAVIVTAQGQCPAMLRRRRKSGFLPRTERGRLESILVLMTLLENEGAGMLTHAHGA